MRLRCSNALPLSEMGAVEPRSDQTAEGLWLREHCSNQLHRFALAGSFSPTRLLTSNFILPAFLSASTIT